MGTKNLTSKEIIKTLKENHAILKKYDVKKIGLFGSYAKGEQKKDSDIDFLVEFDVTAFGKDFKGYFDCYMDLLFLMLSPFNQLK